MTAGRKNGCVLYVMHVDEMVENNTSLALAQAFALHRKVPFAAIGQLPEPTRALDEWKGIEQSLAHYNIPLILVFGEPRVTLSALKQHLNPLAMYTRKTKPDTTTHVLTAHPYTWPGKVIPVAELEAMDNLLC